MLQEAPQPHLMYIYYLTHILVLAHSMKSSLPKARGLTQEPQLRIRELQVQQ